MENRFSDKSDLFSLEIDEQGKFIFHDMIRWTKFMAILGFISMGLMVAGGSFMGVAMSNIAFATNPAMQSAGTVFYILMFVVTAIIYFYPTYALLKYSTVMKVALNTNNKQNFNKAINYLKNMFKYLGILFILGIVVFGIGTIGIMLASMNLNK